MSISNSNSNAIIDNINRPAVGVRCNIVENVALAITTTATAANTDCHATSTFQQRGTSNNHGHTHDDDDNGDDGTDMKIFQSSTRFSTTVLACAIQREVDIVQYRLACLAARKSIRRQQQRQRQRQQQQQINMTTNKHNDNNSNSRNKRSYESMIQNTNYYNSVGVLSFETMERVSLTLRAKRIKKLSTLLHQMEKIQNEIQVELYNSSCTYTL